MIKALPRIRSVDAFRAVTMFLMIFVNDIEDIPNTPQWLHHVADDADGIGLADVIFPAFLFIVGLSIPIALQNRSEGKLNTALYIIKRSVILMFWGFWFTNLETYDDDNAILQSGTWQYLSIGSMFLAFIDYSWIAQAWIKYILQGAGLLLLVFLAKVYRSTDDGQPWLHFTWWGILGLIGWAYLYGALIYHFSGGKLWLQISAWVFFMVYNVLASLGHTDFIYPLYPFIWLAGNGAMQAFTMAGIAVAAFYSYALANNKIGRFNISILIGTVLLGVLGFLISDSTGGISKASETPAWVAICTGICTLVYLVFIFVVDVKGKYNWIKPIEAAGIATLTCFMLPDIFYGWLQTTDLDYPDLIKDGTGGVIRGVVFTFLMVWATALLLKMKIKLKI
ncbi:DUF5009 domain-containing protein [Mucilaginibacter auburnensis]|uniref:Putative acyltransferase n=1 Tax=Mucilaginibacter auburnensis TaxID=1457233 RepID=A0A2H9VQZ0_9SPHI|nr:DUF5009 domain-containing protein [Mucilaginibacter auburnensis]PJJ83235.1 putative acyltransferase [Mucilaginibacter auburnensis]